MPGESRGEADGMSVRVGCPFCNARVLLPAVPADGRAACDRCGETFPVTGGVETVADPAPPPAVAASPPGRGFGLGWYLLAGLLVAGVLLGVGLRVVRQAPPGKPEPSLPPPAAGPVTWPPPTVPLLAHLPADCKVAAAVQPGPLLAHAERTNADPKTLLAGLGVPERAFSTLDAVGLPLAGIDQLAVGLGLPPDSALPRLVLAVRPKPPATAEAVLPKLKAERDRTVNGRQRYRADLGGLPVRLEVRDGVLVLATADADLDRPPTPGSGHLPGGLRETLGRLSPAAFAWAATDAADWPEVPAVKLLAVALKRPDLPGRLKPVRAAGVGLSLEPGLRAAVLLRPNGDPAAFQDAVAAGVAGRDVLVGEADGWTTLGLDPQELPGLVGK